MCGCLTSSALKTNMYVHWVLCIQKSTVQLTSGGLTQAHLSLPCFLNFLPHPYSVSLPPFLALPSFLPLPPLSSLFPPSLTFLSLSPSLASLSLPPSLPFFFLPSPLPLSLPFYSLSPLLSAFLSPSLSPPQHASTDCRSYRGEDELW